MSFTNTPPKTSSTNCSPYTNKGMGLIDVVVGTALMLLVFLSIFAVFRLSVELITVNKARIGALSLAQEQVEYTRSLSYDDVGTVGGIPAGNIPQSETIVLNGTEYTRRVLIQYVDDPKDGEGANDENGITADYKRVKVELSWDVKGKTKKMSSLTNIVPKGIENLSGGGTLIINVFDALGAPVEGANVNIVNNSLNPAIDVDVSTNAQGKVLFPGSPSGNNYEITVTKAGYSTDKTYDVSTQNPNPSPGHLSVIESETTVKSFQIDKVSTKTVRTFTPITAFTWTDTFDDDGKVASSTNVTIQSGRAALTDVGGATGYLSPGLILSDYLTHNQIYEWTELSWSDNEPVNTDVSYQLYYENSSSEPVLIPDSDLSGNSVGFDTSPVDLSSIDVQTYPRIAVGATLSTIDASSTPAILDWSIDYLAGPIPFPNFPFSMRGTKTIGEDENKLPIYKYDRSLQTNSSGVITIYNLEWDNYDISVGGSGYNISESCLPQPRPISPDISTTTDLILVPQSTNSLLVSVYDTNGSLLENASVRLYGNGFDISQSTSSCGQTFFGSLIKGTLETGNPYSVSVSLGGYAEATLNDVEVDGASKLSVMLESI